MGLLSEKDLVSLRERFQSANNPTVISLLDHIAAMEKGIEEDTFCAYCGMKYPKGTPKHHNELLSEHIKVCPEHPMRQAEERIKKLRKALIDGIFAIGGSASEDSLDIFICMLPDEIRAYKQIQIKKLLEPKPIPMELELAKITQTNTDRVPVDFTISEGIANLQIDGNKAWICINGQAAVRIRGFEKFTLHGEDIEQ